MAPRSDQELSELWNTLGRKHRQACSEQISDYYAGKRKNVQAGEDPRDKDLAAEVLERVRELNRRGDWQRARPLFDPAWDPLRHLLEDNGQDLSFVTVLGSDHYLLRFGTGWEEAELLRVDGHEIAHLAGVIACSLSSNRRFFAAAYKGRGIAVREGFGGPLLTEIPWPGPEARIPKGLPPEIHQNWSRREGAPKISDFRLSDDGKRMLVVALGEGVLLADARQEPAVWRLLMPDYTCIDPLEVLLESTKRRKPLFSASVDGLHADLSPDGAFVGLGQHDSEHYLLALDSRDGAYCRKIAPHWEYPHLVRFSGDSRQAAFNSCFYHDGMTGLLELPSAEDPATRESDPQFPIIDPSLKVHAATCLPPEATNTGSSAFVLAGAGWMKCVTPAGDVLWDHFFGSTASSLDYCSRTNTLLLGSFSGFLHVLDVGTEAEPGREIGHRPRKERKRWIFWRDEDAPLQW